MLLEAGGAYCLVDLKPMNTYYLEEPAYLVLGWLKMCGLLSRLYFVTGPDNNRWCRNKEVLLVTL